MTKITVILERSHPTTPKVHVPNGQKMQKKTYGIFLWWVSFDVCSIGYDSSPWTVSKCGKCVFIVCFTAFYNRCFCRPHPFNPKWVSFKTWGLILLLVIHPYDVGDLTAKKWLQGVSPFPLTLITLLGWAAQVVMSIHEQGGWYSKHGLFEARFSIGPQCSFHALPTTLLFLFPLVLPLLLLLPYTTCIYYWYIYIFIYATNWTAWQECQTICWKCF